VVIDNVNSDNVQRIDGRTDGRFDE